MPAQDPFETARKARADRLDALLARLAGRGVSEARCAEIRATYLDGLARCDELLRAKLAACEARHAGNDAALRRCAEAALRSVQPCYAACDAQLPDG